MQFQTIKNLVTTSKRELQIYRARDATSPAELILISNATHAVSGKSSLIISRALSWMNLTWIWHAFPSSNLSISSYRKEILRKSRVTITFFLIILYTHDYSSPRFCLSTINNGYFNPTDYLLYITGTSTLCSIYFIFLSECEEIRFRVWPLFVRRYALSYWLLDQAGSSL